MFKILDRIKHWHKVAYLLVLYDFVTVTFSYFLALWFRFDCRFTHIEPQYLDKYYDIIIPYAIFAVFIYWLLGLYRSIWRFASFYELKKMVYASAITIFCKAVFVTSFVHRMPISYYVFGIGFQFFFGVMIRFSYRFVLLLRDSRAEGAATSNVLLIGAGSAGRMILRDVNFVNGTNGSAKVVAIIDDNENKWGRYIDGVEVIGGRDKI